MGRPRLQVQPSFFIGLCLICFLGPVRLLIYVLLAALCHEVSHLAVLRLWRVPVYQFRLGFQGAVLSAGAAPALAEALSVAAGPLTNGLLVWAFARRAPVFALVNLILCLYNLLPLYPLDGGRLLHLGLVRLLGLAAGERVTRIIAVAVIAAGVFAGVYLTCFRCLGLWPILLAGIFLLRLPNIPCKIRLQRIK